MFGHVLAGQYILFVTVISVCFSRSSAQDKDYWCTNKISNPGPGLPDVPESYTIRAEVTDDKKKYVADMVRSVDIRNGRESVELWAGTRHVQYISLTKSDTFINIIYGSNGPLCTTSVLTKTNKHDVYTEEISGPLRILQILNEEVIPKREKFTASDSDVIRGMSAVGWEICQPVSTLNQVVKVTLYYSDPSWTLAHQNSSKPTMALIRMKAEGFKEGSTEKELSLVLDIYSYESIASADKYYQVPENIYCPDLRTDKKLPDIPHHFSYQAEKLIDEPKGSVVLSSRVFYDYNLNLMRVDSQDTISKDSTTDTTLSQTVVLDFKAGLAYTMNSELGSCETAKLQSSMNVVSKLDGITSIPSPSDFFYIQSKNFSYSGEFGTRGMSTDVFSGLIQNSDKRNDVYFWYFTSDRTKLIKNEVEKNVLVKIISRPESLISKTKTEINIYNFNSEQPSPSVFDISTCYNESQSKSYVIRFPGENNALLEKYTVLLQYRMHLILKEKSGVSLQRISMQKVTFEDKYFLVQFKILDLSNIGQPLKENDLSSAVAKLRDTISAKQLIVTLRTSNTVVRLTAEPDSFKEFKEDNEVTFNEKSVAGLSIGMTVLGFLLGAVVVNLIFTKKYGVSLFQNSSGASDERTFNNPLNESEI